ncbi:uncharacterized protein VTP21DRAFT_10005 [Calcarisporiella thermophila]|uniref:uncharacterized protein n=1 Tax=Calcarisporiella thermophila TaxID=911321 RepID=UPI00374207DD
MSGSALPNLFDSSMSSHPASPPADNASPLRSQNEKLWKIISKQRGIIQSMKEDFQAISLERDHLLRQNKELKREIQHLRSAEINSQFSSAPSGQLQSSQQPSSSTSSQPHGDDTHKSNQTQASRLQHRLNLTGDAVSKSLPKSPYMGRTGSNSGSIDTRMPPTRATNTSGMPDASPATELLNKEISYLGESGGLESNLAGQSHDNEKDMSDRPLIEPSVAENSPFFAESLSNNGPNVHSHSSSDKLEHQSPQQQHREPSKLCPGPVNPLLSSLVGNSGVSVQIEKTESTEGENPYFIINVLKQQPSGKMDELWSIGKSYDDFLALETKLMLHSGHSALIHLPDKSTFKAKSPSILAERQISLERYINHFLSLPNGDNTDVCEFLSTNVLENKNQPQEKDYKEGFLTKISASGFYKLYFSLEHAPYLDYSEKRNGPSLGRIDLSQATLSQLQQTSSLPEGSPFEPYRNAFVIYESRVPNNVATIRHVLCAETDRDRDEWIHNLSRWAQIAPGSSEENKKDDEKEHSNLRVLETHPLHPMKSGDFGECFDKQEKSAKTLELAIDESKVEGLDVPMPNSAPPYKTHFALGEPAETRKGRASVDHTSRHFDPKHSIAGGLSKTAPALFKNEPSPQTLKELQPQQQQQQPQQQLQHQPQQQLRPHEQEKEAGTGAPPSSPPDDNRQPGIKQKLRFTMAIGRLFRSDNNNNSSSGNAYNNSANNNSSPIPNGSTTGYKNGSGSGGQFSSSYNNSSGGSNQGYPSALIPPHQIQRDQHNISNRPPVNAGMYASRPGYARGVFGVPLSETPLVKCADGCELPTVVYRCVTYLEAKGAEKEEGIYRLSGSSATIKMLKDRFSTEGDFDLLGSGEYYDVHAVACLLKLYLRELPQNVLTRELHPRFMSIIDVADRNARVLELGRLVLELPLVNYSLLRTLLGHLLRVVQNSDSNRMTIRNVGIVFSPTLGIPAGIFSLLMLEYKSVFRMENGERRPGEGSNSGEEDKSRLLRNSLPDTEAQELADVPVPLPSLGPSPHIHSSNEAGHPPFHPNTITATAGGDPLAKASKDTEQ